MLVTIIVPVYNVIEYLERCVRSLTSQTYRDLEIILVDDGSTDGSGSLCDKLSMEDARIKVIHQKNGGSSNARNHGILEARGEYIGFVDSDDYVDDYYVEKMVSAICKDNLLMAQISRDEINPDGSRRDDVCIPPEKPLKIKSIDHMIELLMHRGDCSFCTRLSHRSLFGLEGISRSYSSSDKPNLRLFPEGVLNEDFKLLVQMLTDADGLGIKVDRFVILPEQAYHVFYRVGSNSRRKDEDDFSRVFMDIVDNADYVEELAANTCEFEELKSYARRFALFQRLDYMLHIPVSQMNGDNDFYRRVVKYLRLHILSTLFNRYLTLKNRIYLIILTVMPKTVRKVHKSIKK